MARPGVMSSQSETIKTPIIMAPTGLLLEIISAMAGSTPTESAVLLEATGEIGATVDVGMTLELGTTVKADAIPIKAMTERINRRNLLILMLVLVVDARPMANYVGFASDTFSSSIATHRGMRIHDVRKNEKQQPEDRCKRYLLQIPYPGTC